VQRAVARALAETDRTAGALMRRLHELEANWLEARLLAMLEADAARPPFAVAGIEATRMAHIGPLSLEMRPDRVDRLADGSLAVIDYKTGASAEVKAWRDERPSLPQLPAYVLALGAERVGAVAFARVRSDAGGYVGLAREAGIFEGLRHPGGKGWPREFADWNELLGAWRRRLATLAEEYAAGDARLAPDPARACEYCHLGALCRIAATDADVDADAEDGEDG
jgi:hypothetical protein